MKTATDPAKVIMRLGRSHRKARKLKAAIPSVDWLFSFKSGWFYRVPVSDIETARTIGLTIARRY